MISLTLPVRRSLAAGQRLLVDVCGLIDGAEHDRHLDTLSHAPVLELSGEVNLLVTVARRS